MSPKKATRTSKQKSSRGTTTKARGFTEEERAAMKERAQELKSEASRRTRATRSKAEGKTTCSRRSSSRPHRKLSYTWSVPFLDTVVTFMLTPTAAGTHLSLVQSGFKPDQKREFGGARYGWKMMGGKLVDLLDRNP